MKNILNKIVIAGAASLFETKKISKALLSIGIESEFVEAEFMRNYVKSLPDEAMFKECFDEETVIIPLTEYWISYCLQTGHCRISKEALLSSRSKKYLYSLLHKNNILVPSIYSYDEAKIVLNEKNIIVKPEGLNSGLGVEVVSSMQKDNLDEYIRQAQQIQTKNLKLMHIENKDFMLTEYVEGIEYSADVFYYLGRISIVRVCQKKIILINNKPCTLIVKIISPSEHLIKNINNWMNVLFNSENISFAQFDFILNTQNEYVVIDFASRIGGGMKELLSLTQTDPYADAINGLYKLNQKGEGMVQLNYLPIKKGYIIDDNFNLHDGVKYVFKHYGDYVTSLPSSIGSRVALVITDKNIDIESKSIEQSLFIDERWISSNKPDKK